MQSYKFNFQIDSTDYKNIVINDLVVYPIQNVETSYNISEIYVTNIPIEGKSVIEIENFTIPDNLKFGKVLKITSGVNIGSIVNVEYIDLSGSPTSTVIKLFEPLINSSDPFTFSVLTHVFDGAIIDGPVPDNSAIGRSVYSMFVFVQAHETSGIKNILINNGNPVTNASWKFYTDDGGYHTLKAYALRRYSEYVFSNPFTYKLDELTWDYKDSAVAFYKSLIPDNSSSLGDTNSWLLLTGNPSEEELLYHFNISERLIDNIYRYFGNFFVDQKLITLTDKINTAIDCCKCIDPCSVQDNLKLAMYIQQINSLKKLGLYNKAQISYEKALQLAQDLT